MVICDLNRDAGEATAATLGPDAAFHQVNIADRAAVQALVDGIVERYGLEREVVAVEGCRTIGKKDMIRNEATPEIKVDADTYQVWVDGEKVGSEPLEKLPMTQRYFLF